MYVKKKNSDISLARRRKRDEFQSYLARYIFGILLRFLVIVVTVATVSVCKSDSYLYVAR